MKTMVVGINCQVNIIKDILNILFLGEQAESFTFNDRLEEPDYNKFDKIFLQNMNGEKLEK